MKYKIFRIIVLIAAFVPACLVFSLVFFGLLEAISSKSIIIPLMFGSAAFMYIEFAYNTVKLFQDKK